MIRINHLNVAYQKTTVLEDVSLHIKQAGIVGILGPNGAGKSTFFKAILDVIPHQGNVQIQGQPVAKSLKKIAYVEQKAELDYNFPITVRDCVALGLFPKQRFLKPFAKADWKKVDQALNSLGLSDLAHRQIRQVSGGQFQRVLLARCLVQEADIILLDEPFVGIDSVSEDIIMTTLRRLKDEGKLILIIHHDLNKVTHYFDSLILINHGLIAQGPTETTFTEENLRKTYGSGLFFKGGIQ